MRLVKIAAVADIPAEKARAFECEGRVIALFHIGDAFHAINGECPHRNGPLAEGDRDGHIVTCPWHAWRFDVTTGECPDMPAARAGRYATRVDGDDIFIELDD